MKSKLLERFILDARSFLKEQQAFVGYIFDDGIGDCGKGLVRIGGLKEFTYVIPKYPYNIRLHNIKPCSDTHFRSLKKKLDVLLKQHYYSVTIISMLETGLVIEGYGPWQEEIRAKLSMPDQS